MVYKQMNEPTSQSLDEYSKTLHKISNYEVYMHRFILSNYMHQRIQILFEQKIKDYYLITGY